MKKVFLIAMVMTGSAYAGSGQVGSVGTTRAVSLIAHDQRSATATIQVSGEDGQMLRKILEDNQIEIKDSDSDTSTIRKIVCGSSGCALTVRADVQGAQDVQDYYADAYNRKLKSLKGNEVLLSAPMMGMEPGDQNYNDGLLIRALQLSRFDSGNVELRVEKNTLRSADQWLVPVLEVSLKMRSFTLRCSSGINIMTGVKNSLHESCQLQTVAEKAVK